MEFIKFDLKKDILQIGDIIRYKSRIMTIPRETTITKLSIIDIVIVDDGFVSGVANIDDIIEYCPRKYQLYDNMEDILYLNGFSKKESQIFMSNLTEYIKLN